MWTQLIPYKYKLGKWLLRKGATLYFVTEEDREELKNRINSDTWFGSFIETGNHLVYHMQPMNDYDTQSVINVLKHIEPNYNRITSEREEYYKDVWLSDGEHKESN